MEPRRVKRVGRLAVVALGAAGLVAATVVAAPWSHAAEPVVVSTSDFENGTTQGWFARGSSTVAASTVIAHSGTTSLLASNRTETWQGPGRDVLALLQRDAVYTISAQLRLPEGAAPVAVHATVQRTPTGGTTTYERVGSQTVTADGWVALSGEYSFAVDSSELQLYFESDATASYFLDDIVITQIQPPPGGPQDEVGVVTDFETGTAQGWRPRINSETLTPTTAAAHSGQYSLLTTTRTQAYAGPAINLLGKMGKGKNYTISLWLRLAPGEAPAPLRVSLERRLGEAITYETVVSNNTVTPDGWVRFTNNYTLAHDVDFLSLYVESNGVTPSFYLDDFALTWIKPIPIQTDIPSLKDVLDFPIGTAMDRTETVGLNAQLLTKHFDQITPGNALKWDATEPTEGQFSFAESDALVNFGVENGLTVRGHTLVWHSQTPAWVFNRPDGTPLTDSAEDKALLLQRIENHIRAVAGRYAGTIKTWDVVNEIIDEYQADGLRRSRWYEIAGLDYVRTAFRVAREVVPDAKLYINDYNSEQPTKRGKLFNLVKQLRAEGVPIDGVGHQVHINVTRPPVQYLDDTLTQFATLGVLQEVTELDVSVYTNFTESFTSVPPEIITQQGYRYRDIFDVFRRHKNNLASVTIWGQTDANTWLKSFPFPRLDQPLLFDELLQAKPAYWGVVDPTKLPPLIRTASASKGTVVIDGHPELEWNLSPPTTFTSGTGLTGSYKTRWDGKKLYVLVDVNDTTANANDAVDIFLDRDNSKSTTYGAGDSKYTVKRGPGVWQNVSGPGWQAVAHRFSGGWRVEGVFPLTAAGAVDQKLGLDIRIRDTARAGQPVSWNDQLHGQDTDTSRWGTLTLAKAVSRVDAFRGTPVIDGTADAAWRRAPSITTGIRVQGTSGATATAKLLWDDRYLYILATVTDPTLDESSPNAYEQDSVEIFVDPPNNKYTGYDDDDGQYRISFSNKQSVSGNFNAFAIADNLTSATTVTATGYVVEARIELDTIQPADGTLVGFDLQVNDATAGTRTSAAIWNDQTGKSYLDTSGWGVARLVRR